MHRVATLQGGQDAVPCHSAGMVDFEVVEYRPAKSELAWTFGGVAPVRQVLPGTVLELWTEDAFAGRVRSETDLVSQVGLSSRS